MFTAAVNGSISRKNNTTGYYESRESRTAEYTNGFARRQSYEDHSKLLEMMLTFDKTFGKHRVNAVAGYSYQDFMHENFMAQNRNFTTDLFSYNNLGAGNDLLPTDVGSYKSMNKLISFYARANYAYADKYIFTGTVHRDGSTKFGADNK
ncbi:MAG: TonB-dependent receptor [Tannerellaceae bacterium]|nr:TonB-dependent receptor [Tannerellaceae bacterium]MCD8264350.1 TonB-dependent receptor [Tannerellaceae bacterium]